MAAGTLDEAFDAYEQDRRPAVDHLQSIALRSMLWWDSFPDRMTEMPVEQLMIAYMTRAGKVSLERFAESAPRIARRGVAAYAGVSEDDVPPSSDLVDWILERPLIHGSGRFDGRVVPHMIGTEPTTRRIDVGAAAAWGDGADRLLGGLPPAEIYLLVGPADRESLLNRFDFAERVRRATASLVVVDVPKDQRADAAAALVSQRVDLVTLSD